MRMLSTDYVTIIIIKLHYTISKICANSGLTHFLKEMDHFCGIKLSLTNKNVNICPTEKVWCGGK